MKVDDFNGELVETEDASNGYLATMDADYTKYLGDPKTQWYGGRYERDKYIENHREITWEIEQRKKEGRWGQ